MIGVDTTREINLTSSDVREALKERQFDIADRGFAESQERVPQDRGGLQQSGFPPEERAGGRVVFGYTAAYARPIEEGTGPYYPPLEPLIEWAERIGAGPGLGYYVAREKIPEEGIDAQPYLEPAAEKMEDYMRTRGLERYL